MKRPRADRAAEAPSAQSEPPDASLLEGRKRKSIQSGVGYVFRLAQRESNVVSFGNDLIQFFYDVGLSSEEPLRRTCLMYCSQVSYRWRLLMQKKGWMSGEQPTSQEVIDAVVGIYCMDHLGLSTDLRQKLLPHFCGPESPADGSPRQVTTETILGWCPRTEEPPAAAYDRCSDCGELSARGLKNCSRCKTPLAKLSRYRVFSNALIYSFFFTEVGLLPPGMDYLSVLCHLWLFHPYCPPSQMKQDEFIDQCYLVTHIVFTLNNWGSLYLNPSLLPHEYYFLLEFLPFVIGIKDVHLTGEFLEALNSFGRSDSDPSLQSGVCFLLDSQDPMGGWDVDKDQYTSYHATMVACQGLLRPHKRGYGPCFVDCLDLLQGLVREDLTRLPRRYLKTFGPSGVVWDESWERLKSVARATFSHRLEDPYLLPESPTVDATPGAPARSCDRSAIPSGSSCSNEAVEIAESPVSPALSSIAASSISQDESPLPASILDSSDSAVPIEYPTLPDPDSPSPSVPSPLNTAGDMAGEVTLDLESLHSTTADEMMDFLRSALE